MEWECHACGHPHASIPAACESCGTEPEIVRNNWRCAHCGHQEISSEDDRCPACGADRKLGVETAVDVGNRVEGALGRELAEGEWKYCAYCEVQVAPVDAQGQPQQGCPTCKGPLSEAERAAAMEDLLTRS